MNDLVTNAFLNERSRQVSRPLPPCPVASRRSASRPDRVHIHEPELPVPLGAVPGRVDAQDACLREVVLQA